MMKTIKKKIKQVHKKIEPKITLAITIWQWIVSIIIVSTLIPLFLMNYQKKEFYYIVLSISILIIGLISIIKNMFGKETKFRKYITESRTLLLIAGIILLIANYIPDQTIKKIILIISAGVYAAGERRLGISTIFGSL